MRPILVTGSSGLIGSEVVAHLGGRGFAVHGVDNNQRAVFFGPAGDTRRPAQPHPPQGARDALGV